ncbi:MAG: hypothetical protein WC449_01825 [Candidatus Paceibacterota bacterium]
MDKVLISRLLKIGGIIAAFAILFAVDAWLYENKNNKFPPVRSELEEEEQFTEEADLGGDRTVGGQIATKEEFSNNEIEDANSDTQQKPSEITIKSSEIKISSKPSIKPQVAGVNSVLTEKIQYQILAPNISRAMGFSFKYPANIFKVSAGKTSLLLFSQYSFISNFSGLSGQKMSHNYSIEFVNYNSDLQEALKKEMPYAVGQIFKDGKFVPVPGYAEKFSLAGQDGFVVMEGAEGLNMHYFFLPKTAKTSLVIRFKFIGENLKPKLSEIEQKKYFNEVLSSLVIKK